MATLRLGDPLDKNTDIGAINSAEQLARIRELSDAGEAEGAQRWSPPCELPARGFWFPPTIFTGVSASHRIAQEEIFGPVLSVLTFRTPQEAVDKANNTPYGLSAGIWTEKGSRILWMARQAARRRRLGEHVQPLRPGLAVRRLQGVGLRPRGRPARPGGLPCRSAERAAPARAQDLQARHRRRVPALGVGPLLSRRGRLRRRCSRTPRRPRARTCATRSSRRARRSRAGRRATAYNRGQVIYRVAEMLDGRREQFAAEVAAAEGLAAAAALAHRRRVDRPHRLVRRLGRQVRPGRGLGQPDRRPVLQLLAARADRRRRAPGAAGLEPARLRQRARARALHRQHRRDRRLASAARCRPSRSPRCSRPRTSRAASSTS